MDDYYETLGCAPSSSAEQLKQAFQSLVLKLHPDKLPADLPEQQRQLMIDRFVAVDRAYKVLSVPHLRAEYDARWSQRRLAQQWPIQDTVDFDEFEEFEYNGNRRAFVYPCRCGGDYFLLPLDINFRVDLVCCESCSLCIKVTYKNSPDIPLPSDPEVAEAAAV